VGNEWEDQKVGRRKDFLVRRMDPDVIYLRNENRVRPIKGRIQRLSPFLVRDSVPSKKMLRRIANLQKKIS